MQLYDWSDKTKQEIITKIVTIDNQEEEKISWLESIYSISICIPELYMKCTLQYFKIPRE